GAYYAYAEFVKYTGSEPVPLSYYQSGQQDGFKGSFYNLTLDKTLAEKPDTLIYYQPFISSKFIIYNPEGTQEIPILKMDNLNTEYKYAVFLGGDHPLGRITTSVTNGKKIAVIKDSYGNAFIPFLLPHYQEIFVIDPRHYKEDLGKLVRDNGIQELLVLDYAVAPRFEAYVKSLQQLAERTSQL
ncbi:MAG: DHHW family protein, partial [Methylocystaceae bacterium]